MQETITAMEARRRFGDILNRVSLRHEEFVIERNGKPLAAVVPMETLERMREAARTYLLDALRRQRTVLSQAEVDRLANEAKHRSRERRHG